MTSIETMKIYRNMKTSSLLLPVVAALLGALSGAQAITITWDSGFLNSGAIPDGNVTGWSDTRTISGLTGGNITDLSVNLQFAGGYNGDYYVTLTHSSGFSVLLNRVGRTSGNGFGYGDAGVNITLADGVGADIHNYGGTGGNQLTGTWQPDGRYIDPANALDTSARLNLLSQFNGLDPNGTWTLFIADMSGGDVGNLQSWGLNISVPDGGSTLVLLGLAVAGLGLVRARRIGLPGRGVK